MRKSTVDGATPPEPVTAIQQACPSSDRAVLQQGTSPAYTPSRIVSGGQTGADRAGLDWAIAHNIPHGGFCPKGRVAEDGEIPPHYRLIQTRSAEYPARTEANIKASDATLIFIDFKMGRGSRLTEDLCHQLNKPYFVVSASTPLSLVISFLALHQPKVLNIAGSKASTAPTIYTRVQTVLDAVMPQTQTALQGGNPSCRPHS